MATPSRAPITCHVLDTTTGRPGANISVKLSCVSGSEGIGEIALQAITNADGRIANWKLPDHNVDKMTLGELVKGMASEEAATTIIRHLIGLSSLESNPKPGRPVNSSLWKLQFDTGSYYGLEKTFFPTVELTFAVKDGEHYHVPLLLGPYSFTTYRGS